MPPSRSNFEYHELTRRHRNGTEDHRFLRRHRQRPRRAGARPPARLLRRRALARLRPPLPRRGARAEGGGGAAGPRRRLGRRPGHAPPRRRQRRHQRRPGRTGRARERRRDRLRLRVPHRPRHGQARDLGPQTAARRPGGDRRRPGRPALDTPRSASTRSASSTRATRAARETADSLAAALGASVAEHGGGPVDLLVVGSRPESPQGKVTLSAASDYAVEAATYPVLVVPRGVALSFGGDAQAPSRGSEDEDHGRDLRVAAVDPLPAPSASSIGRGRRCPRRSSPRPPRLDRSRPRRRSAIGGGGAPLGLASTRAGHVLGRSARRSTSPGRRRGRGRRARGPRGSSARSRSGPTRGRRARSAGPSSQGSSDLAPQLLALEVEDAGVAAVPWR